MFTGMSLRMAQELGLHRQRTSIGSGISQSPATSAQMRDDQKPPESASATDLITTEAFEKSSQIVPFWCIFIQDACLSSGTG